MKSKLTMTTILWGILTTFLTPVRAQDTTGVYISSDLSGQLVLLPSYINEEFYEDPFEFNLDGYLGFAFEVGKNLPIGQLGVYYRYGKSMQSYEFEKDGGFNEEVDFESFSNIGINFKRKLWENKKRRKFELMLNYRTSATYHNFKGKQYFDGETFETGTIEDYSENIFGLELALYLQFGIRKEDNENKVKILWEPGYIRAQTKGFGIGVQKLGVQINL
ncbi:MAG: hypothetical protein ACMZ7B_04505 [Balneola sp.]